MTGIQWVRARDEVRSRPPSLYTHTTKNHSAQNVNGAETASLRANWLEEGVAAKAAKSRGMEAPFPQGCPRAEETAVLCARSWCPWPRWDSWEGPLSLCAGRWLCREAGQEVPRDDFRT